MVVWGCCLEVAGLSDCTVKCSRASSTTVSHGSAGALWAEPRRGKTHPVGWNAATEVNVLPGLFMWSARCCTPRSHLQQHHTVWSQATRNLHADLPKRKDVDASASRLAYHLSEQAIVLQTLQHATLPISHVDSAFDSISDSHLPHLVVVPIAGQMTTNLGTPSAGMVGTHWDGDRHLVNHAARCRSAHPTLTAASHGINWFRKEENKQ